MKTPGIIPTYWKLMLYKGNHLSNKWQVTVLKQRGDGQSIHAMTAKILSHQGLVSQICVAIPVNMAIIKKTNN